MTENFMTVLPKYRKLLNDESPYVYVPGDRRSGKTVFCCQYAINYAIRHANSHIFMPGLVSENIIHQKICTQIVSSFAIPAVRNCTTTRILFVNGSCITICSWGDLEKKTTGYSVDVLVADSMPYELSDKEQEYLLELYDRNHFITVYSEDILSFNWKGEDEEKIQDS